MHEAKLMKFISIIFQYFFPDIFVYWNHSRKIQYPYRCKNQCLSSFFVPLWWSVVRRVRPPRNILPIAVVLQNHTAAMCSRWSRLHARVVIRTIPAMPGFPATKLPSGVPSSVGACPREVPWRQHRRTVLFAGSIMVPRTISPGGKSAGLFSQRVLRPDLVFLALIRGVNDRAAAIEDYGVHARQGSRWEFLFRNPSMVVWYVHPVVDGIIRCDMGSVFHDILVVLGLVKSYCI